MAQWHVTQGDNQFAIGGGLGELEAMARRGELKPGDMIQPPGAVDWMYASEIPELSAIFERIQDDDDDAPAQGMFGAAGLAVAGVVAVGLLGVILLGGGAMLYFASSMSGGGGELIGEGGLTYSEMIVTAQGSGLRAEADATSRITAPIKKDDTLELLAKRGTFYKARAKSGVEGWIPIDHVIPMYQLGGLDVRDEYDPLYNPDRYVEVANARWIQLPAENPRPGNLLSNVTIFEFMMGNEARYPMTDLVILATIKDAQGQELDKVEIKVEGQIPAAGSTFVGTLAAEEVDPKGKKRKPKDEDAPPDRIMTTWSFEQMAEDDPELQLRWTSGVEVEMKTENFTNAQIDILELRAVPDAKAAKDVRGR